MKRDASISDEQFNEEMDLLLNRAAAPHKKLRDEIVKLQDECRDDMQYKILELVLEKLDFHFNQKQS